MGMQAYREIINEFNFFHPGKDGPIGRLSVTLQQAIEGKLEGGGVHWLAIVKPYMGVELDIPGEIVNRFDGLSKVRYWAQTFRITKEKLIVDEPIDDGIELMMMYVGIESLNVSIQGYINAIMRRCDSP